MIDFASVQDSISAALIETTRTVARLAAEDVSFHRSADSATAQALEASNKRLLSLTSRLLTLPAPVPSRKALVLHNLEEIDGAWRTIVDTVDGSLERADICLDEFRGVRKPSISQRQPGPTSTKARTSRLGQSFRTQDIAKPQLSFDRQVSNYEKEPFKPFLSAKPHAIVALAQSHSTLTNEYGLQQFQHPYESELKQYRYPSFVHHSVPPIAPTSFDATNATFVDSMEGVHLMLNDLRNAQEIAVDLEHHDAHSYIGLVSLMQISTRTSDWIIDTLKPWRHQLEILNEVFANPKIIKVLHGAQSDIIWLQRDLGLYIVGLFDTYHASRALGYAGHSLAFLLKKFVDFDAQKQYQMADWRIRPLPKELLDYARSDTHFLLFIYDSIRNALLEKSDRDITMGSYIDQVFRDSQETALQRYEYPYYDQDRAADAPNGWLRLLRRHSAALSPLSEAVFRKLHGWRDSIARSEDESIHQIMPNHVLLAIATTLPQDAKNLLMVSHPMPKYLRGRIQEVLSLVEESKQAFVSHNPLFPSTGTLTGVTKTNPPQEFVDVEVTAGKADFPVTQSLGHLAIRTCNSEFWGPLLQPPANTTHSSNSGRSNHHDPFHICPNERLLLLGTQDKFPNETLISDQARGETIAQASESTALRETHSPRAEKFQESLQKTMIATAKRAAPSPTHDWNEPEPKRVSLEPTRRMVEQRAEKKFNNSRAPVNHASALRAPSQSEPFDYTNASSVLHPTKHGKSDRQFVKAKFDPFVKASDAPDGLQKAQAPRAGKSFTFKR